jgi:hypothetical protein
MFGEENSVQTVAPGGVPGKSGLLPIVAVLALGVSCGIAGAMLWSRRVSKPTSTPAVVSPVAASTVPVDSTPELRRVSIQEIEGRTQVTLTLDQMVPYDAHRLSNPYRIYVDLHGLHIAPELSRTVQVDAGGIQRIRMAQTQADAVRVVLDVNSPFRYSIAPQSNPPRLVMEMISGHAGAEAKLQKSKSAAQ